jgi:hypothetical protein
LDMVWSKAVAQASNETGLNGWPSTCPWSIESEVLEINWRPISVRASS